MREIYFLHKLASDHLRTLPGPNTPAALTGTGVTTLTADPAADPIRLVLKSLNEPNESLDLAAVDPDKYINLKIVDWMASSGGAGGAPGTAQRKPTVGAITDSPGSGGLGLGGSGSGASANNSKSNDAGGSAGAAGGAAASGAAVGVGSTSPATAGTGAIMNIPTSAARARANSNVDSDSVKQLKTYLLPVLKGIARVSTNFVSTVPATETSYAKQLNGILQAAVTKIGASNDHLRKQIQALQEIIASDDSTPAAAAAPKTAASAVGAKPNEKDPDGLVQTTLVRIAIQIVRRQAVCSFRSCLLLRSQPHVLIWFVVFLFVGVLFLLQLRSKLAEEVLRLQDVVSRIRAKYEVLRSRVATYKKYAEDDEEEEKKAAREAAAMTPEKRRAAAAAAKAKVSAEIGNVLSSQALIGGLLRKLQLDVSESLTRHLQGEVPDTVFDPPRASGGGGPGSGRGRKGSVFAFGPTATDEKSAAHQLVLGDDDSVFPRYCAYYPTALDTFGTVGKFSIDDMVNMCIGGLPITEQADKWLLEKKILKKNPAAAASAASGSAGAGGQKEEDVFAWTSFAQLIPNFRVCCVLCFVCLCVLLCCCVGGVVLRLAWLLLCCVVVSCW